MKFLRFFVILFLSAPLLHSEEWTVDKGDKTKKKVIVGQKSVAVDAQVAAPAAPVEAAGLPGMSAPAPASQAAPAPAPAAQGMGYAVQKGDNLWNLAGQFYQDPYKWGKIWEANKNDVRNPNLIYPDQRVVIPGVAAPAPEAAAPSVEPAAAEEAAEAPAEEPAEEAAAEAAAPSSAPAPAPSKKAAKLAALRNDSFVVDPSWQGDGKIVGDQDKKIMISQDDVVYLNLGASNGLKPRMRGVVYRKGRQVRDPNTRDSMGNIMRRVGTVQVTEQISDETCSAVVVTSYEPLRVGDIVKIEE